MSSVKTVNVLNSIDFKQIVKNKVMQLKMYFFLITYLQLHLLSIFDLCFVLSNLNKQTRSLKALEIFTRLKLGKKLISYGSLIC